MIYYTDDLNGRRFYFRDSLNANPDGPHNNLYLGDCSFFFTHRSNVLQVLQSYIEDLHMDICGQTVDEELEW